MTHKKASLLFSALVQPRQPLGIGEGTCEIVLGSRNTPTHWTLAVKIVSDMNQEVLPLVDLQNEDL
jgi:hypothetical protein